MSYTRTLPSARLGGVLSLARMAAGTLRYVSTWAHNLRSRRDLAHLDDHMLNDIGLTRDQARREAQKPFWETSTKFR